uniref:Uncharacterized protein n=1 Tax=Arundo donax TaxID=35708 RepID=A0A0A9FA43_ARUDO
MPTAMFFLWQRAICYFNYVHFSCHSKTKCPHK